MSSTVAPTRSAMSCGSNGHTNPHTSPPPAYALPGWLIRMSSMSPTFVGSTVSRSGKSCGTSVAWIVACGAVRVGLGDEVAGTSVGDGMAGVGLTTAAIDAEGTDDADGAADDRGPTEHAPTTRA